MPKIKLSFPANIVHIEKQTPGLAAGWGDCQFLINQEVAECDAWVVCEGLPLPTESTKCPRDNMIFITGEPYSIWHYDKNFLKQFAKVITCQREIKGPGVTYGLQGHGWHVGLNFTNPEDLGWAKGYDELINTTNVHKTKLLSIITSNKQSTVGHRQRYKFALVLKEVLGDQADLFGRGINDFNDKWDVLAPYKYSVAIENCATDDYITEKLNDCFLTHTFPFYYGAPNVGDYYPADAYSLIDINKFTESIDKIKKIINDLNHYQNHLAPVLEAKIKCLNHYHIFPLVTELISGWPADKTKEKITLKNCNSGLSCDNRLRIINDKLRMVFDKIIKH